MHAVFSSGSVLANGKPLVENDRHAIAYIAQEDHLMPTSTVFDTLNLSAQLRLPRSWSAERKSARVEELLRLFRLEKHRDTLVGSVRKTPFVCAILNAKPIILPRQARDKHRKS